MPFISANNGPDEGRRYELKGPKAIVGRHPDCEIVVDVGAVSRQHAKFFSKGSSYYVEDLGSRNGTYLNNEIIHGAHKLGDGDSIRVCDVAFTYHLQPTNGPGKPDKTQTEFGGETMLIDDDGSDGGSTITSKLDVSSSHGRIHVTASPEVKLNALIEITRSLGKSLKLDQVLPNLLEGLFKIFVQADRGFIVLKTANAQLVPMWTKVRRQESDDTIRISRTIVRQVMESKEAILSADAASDERFELSQSIADFRIRSMMCAPLLDTEGNALGVLQVDTLDQRKRFQQEDLEVLASVASQAGIAIDNAQLHENALKQRAIERDLQVAHEVQNSFLPDKPPQMDGYQFFNYYQPANHVGGDYFDYILLPDGRIAVIVADVVGHGVAAALLMAKLAAEARFCLAIEPHVSTAVNQLNDAISNLQLDRFVTMIMAVIDPKTHHVTIVNAGHMAPIYRKKNGSLEQPGEDVAGLPLGIVANHQYKQFELTLSAGESLTMYTDGINECYNAGGEQYRIDRIRKHVSEAGGASVEAIGQRIIEDVRAFLGNQQQDDDMCLVCVGRS